MTSLFLEVYAALVFLGGIAAFFLFIKRLPKIRSGYRPQVRPWQLRWLDFGFLLWLLFVSLLLSQGLASALLPGEVLSGGEQIVAAFAVQMGLLITFVLFRRYLPWEKRQPMNLVPVPTLAAAGKGMFFLLASLPLIFAVGAGWKLFLDFLVGLGLDLPTERQMLVDYFMEVSNPLTFLALAVLAVLVAPVVEELIFRGGVYSFLKSKVSVPFAMFGSGLLFALLHLNLLSFPALLVVGISLCVAYELGGNLKIPIFFHAFFNLNTVVLIALS